MRRWGKKTHKEKRSARLIHAVFYGGTGRHVREENI